MHYLTLPFLTRTMLFPRKLRKPEEVKFNIIGFSNGNIIRRWDIWGVVGCLYEEPPALVLVFIYQARLTAIYVPYTGLSYRSWDEMIGNEQKSLSLHVVHSSALDAIARSTQGRNYVRWALTFGRKCFPCLFWARQSLALWFLGVYNKI